MFSVQTLKKGFTLVELMIVMAVIAILATISFFGLSTAQKSARDTQRQQILNGIRAQLEKYNGDKSAYPGGASGTQFTDMFVSLSTAGYMTSMVDPGCGSGPIAWPTSVAGAAAANAWIPCSGVVWYSYGSAGSTYTLYLQKESGGILTLKSPQ